MSDIKVGDELAVPRRFGGWDFYTVDSITPSGRIKCGHFVLNPDLSIRGASPYGPYSACLATDEMRAEMQDRHERTELIQKIDDVRWKNVTTDQLRRIVAILDEGKS